MSLIPSYPCEVWATAEFERSCGTHPGMDSAKQLLRLGRFIGLAETQGW